MVVSGAAEVASSGADGPEQPQVTSLAEAKHRMHSYGEHDAKLHDYVLREIKSNYFCSGLAPKYPNELIAATPDTGSLQLVSAPFWLACGGAANPNKPS